MTLVHVMQSLAACHSLLLADYIGRYRHEADGGNRQKRSLIRGEACTSRMTVLAVKPGSHAVDAPARREAGSL